MPRRWGDKPNMEVVLKFHKVKLFSQRNEKRKEKKRKKRKKKRERERKNKEDKSAWADR